MSNGYKYDPTKGTHFGIPQRDLTAGEVEAMGPMEQRTVRLSPAYRELTDDEVRQAQVEAEVKSSDKDLNDYKRAELEEMATSVGVESPKKFANKGSLVEAIQEAIESTSDADDAENVAPETARANQVVELNADVTSESSTTDTQHPELSEPENTDIDGERAADLEGNS
jgi:hypothetical protein